MELLVSLRKPLNLRHIFQIFVKFCQKERLYTFKSAISKEKRGKASPSSPRTKSFFDY